MSSVIWFIVGVIVGAVGAALVARNNEKKAADLIAKIPGK